MAARAAMMLAYFRSVERKHPGLVGGRREDLLRDFLMDFLPGRLAVERGEVVSTDPEGSTSSAVDLIVSDAAETPLLDRSPAGGVVVPVEGVYAVIEVSSMLDGRKLEEELDNIRSVKRMSKRAWFTTGVPPAEPTSLYGRQWGRGTPEARGFPPLGFCFAYDSQELETLRKHLAALDDTANAWNNVDVICSLSKGCIINGVPYKDRDGNVVKTELGTVMHTNPASTPVPGLERIARFSPKDDEGADALKTFYTHAFGTVVRLRTEPINMWEYQRRDPAWVPDEDA